MIRFFVLFVLILGVLRLLLESKEQTLSKETIKIIKNIKKDIYVSFYFSRPVLRRASYGQEFNSLAYKVRTLLQEIASHNPKIRLDYSEPNPYSEKYLEGVGKGLRTLPLKNKVDLLFGVIFDSKDDEKSSSLSFIDLGDEKNLTRNILKKILIISKKRPPLYVFSGQSLFHSTSFKKKVFFRELYEWFDIKLVKGDEDNLSPDIPIMVIDPRFIPEEILSFVKNQKTKVILVWDPYQTTGAPRQGLSIDSSLNMFLKSEGISFIEGEVLFDKTLAGKSFISSSLFKKKIPFFLSCKDNCLKQNNLSSFDRIDFVFAGATKKNMGVGLFDTSEESGLIKVQDTKNLNFYSDFSKKIPTVIKKYSVVEKYGRFLIFNDIDFLSEKFLGLRDGEDFFFENDNLNFFLSLINKEVFKINDPFSVPTSGQNKIIFSFYDDISAKHQEESQDLLSSVNKEINNIQNKIVNLEASLVLTENQLEKVKKTETLTAEKNNLRLKYQSLKLIQYNLIHKLDFYQNLLKRINYFFLCVLFLLCLVVKRKLNRVIVSSGKS